MSIFFLKVLLGSNRSKCCGDGRRKCTPNLEEESMSDSGVRTHVDESSVDSVNSQTVRSGCCLEIRAEPPPWGENGVQKW